MARPPKPTAQLALVGAIKRNPKRYEDRKEEPQPDTDVGTPPDTLTPEQLQAWNELLENAAEGVITKQDRHWLEYAAQAIAAYRSDPTDNQTRAWFDKALSKLGFNPVERTKVAKA